MHSIINIIYTNIKAEILINFEDSIKKLTNHGTYKKGYCDCYEYITMRGKPYSELSNRNDNPYLFR